MLHRHWLWLLTALFAAIPLASKPVLGQGSVVLVLDDMGLSQDIVNDVADMPPMTISLLPYADHLQQKAAQLRSAGHELMVHMPMEAKNPDADPGPNALLSSLSDAELQRRIDWNLGRFDGFIGVNNHMGSLLSEKARPMVRIMSALKMRGLMYLDSLTSPASLGRRAARAAGVPFSARDVFLDNERDASKILSRLRETEDLARRRGRAIAIGHPYKVTLDSIRSWREAAEARGTRIIFLADYVAMARPDSKSLARAR